MGNRGKLITLEGVEGAGKSTSLVTVLRLLRSAGINVVQSREPGGTELGEEVRELLLKHRDGGISGESELLLMFAARAEHMSQVIKPALNRGDWVLCDRFVDASYAYQGGGRGIPQDRIRQLHRWLMDDFQPDLTLLLDIPVEIGLGRAGRRSDPDRFEVETTAFFERVRNTYLMIAAAEPSRMKVVNATQVPADVEQDIAQILETFID